MQLNAFFSKAIRDQIRDIKKIPIIIISYNQLKSLKELVTFLQDRGYNNIVIIDNCSTFEPLRTYLEEIESAVKVIYLNSNYGHQVFWKRKDLFSKYAKGYYVVTDPDVIPFSSCPDDFLLYFKNILENQRNINKVGFSLNLEHIPYWNPERKNIFKRQEKFWKIQDAYGNYLADIDTTFALYRPSNFSFLKNSFYSAIRTKSPYVAKHGGWFINPINLSEEQLLYLQTSNSSGSWKLDEKGKLRNKKFDYTK